MVQQPSVVKLATRAAGAGVRSMALGADETARLAQEGVKPTDDDAKYTWSTAIGGKVMAMFDGDTLSTSTSQSGGTAHAPPSTDEPPLTVGVVLDATPFYAEAGGQVADSGKIVILSGDGAVGGGGDVRGVVEVADVRMFGGFALDVGRLVSGSLSVGDSVRCEVDYKRRGRVAPNHTMTHALNYALRQAVGEGVDQKGSLVTDEKLRFDFSHGKALTGPQLEETEAIVQRIIEEKRPVYNQEVSVLQLCKSIVETGPDFFSIHGVSSTAPFSFISESFCQRLQVYPEDILGRPLSSIVDPRDTYALARAVQFVLNGGYIGARARGDATVVSESWAGRGDSSAASTTSSSDAYTTASSSSMFGAEGVEGGDGDSGRASPTPSSASIGAGAAAAGAGADPAAGPGTGAGTAADAAAAAASAAAAGVVAGAAADGGGAAAATQQPEPEQQLKGFSNGGAGGCVVNVRLAGFGLSCAAGMSLAIGSQGLIVVTRLYTS